MVRASALPDMSYEEAALSSVQDLYEKLATGQTGLASSEAKKRLEAIGPNLIPTTKKTNLSSKDLDSNKEPIQRTPVDRFLPLFRNRCPAGRLGYPGRGTRERTV